MRSEKALSVNRAVDSLEQHPTVEAISEKLQDGVRAIFQGGGETGRTVRDLLHGTWLGHPLHAAVTDIPVGAWTAAVVLDSCEAATGDEAFGKASEVAITLGLAGAVLAAASGANDWQYTDGRARRIGAVHALLNIGGTALFASSLIARKKEKKRAGRALAMIGWSGLLASAYLGGHLVYRERVGMDHNPPAPGPEEWTPVLSREELPERVLRKVEVSGEPVLLYRRGDRITAIGERCAHMGGPLSEGSVEEDRIVVCPWHGSRFDVESGALVHGPSVYSQPCYEVRTAQGRIEIRRARAEEGSKRSDAEAAPEATTPERAAP